MKNLWLKLKKGIKARKGLTAFIAVVVIIGSYIAYNHAKTANAQPQYVLFVARMERSRRP